MRIVATVMHVAVVLNFPACIITDPLPLILEGLIIVREGIIGCSRFLLAVMMVSAL